MRLLGWILLVSLAALLPARAASDYVIDAILPLTGPAAFVGGGEKLGIVPLEELINRQGGIDGSPLKIVFHDDETSPQLAVQLLDAALVSHPAVVFGSTITSMCNAMAPLVAAKGPLLYCFSPGVHPPAGSYEFSAAVSTGDLFDVLFRYFRLKGWTHLAYLVSSDATGQDAENGMNQALALPENKSITMVARAHFNPGDISVSAQIATMNGAHPQAIIAWTTGTALATILKGLTQAGIDLPVATGNGNMSVSQLAQYKNFTPKHLYIAAAYFSPHAGIFHLDPRVEAVQQQMYGVMRAHGQPIDTQSTQAYDPVRIVVDALRKLGKNATADQLRAYIAGLTNYPGASGIYDFKKMPQRGIDGSDAVVTEWMPATKTFDWASAPGGALLAR